MLLRSTVPRGCPDNDAFLALSKHSRRTSMAVRIFAETAFWLFPHEFRCVIFPHFNRDLGWIATYASSAGSPAAAGPTRICYKLPMHASGVQHLLPIASVVAGVFLLIGCLSHFRRPSGPERNLSHPQMTGPIARRECCFVSTADFAWRRRTRLRPEPRKTTPRPMPVPVPGTAGRPQPRRVRQVYWAVEMFFCAKFWPSGRWRLAALWRTS
jgi:hypothetical protein